MQVIVANGVIPPHFFFSIYGMVPLSRTKLYCYYSKNMYVDNIESNTRLDYTLPFGWKERSNFFTWITWPKMRPITLLQLLGTFHYIPLCYLDTRKRRRIEVKINDFEKKKRKEKFINNIYIINRIKRPREWKKAAYL